ncbi:hypothetical protein BSKO_12307 [Bryopsis sp. KO-2023]|nr:hypothetical protein BSKO_12307 [Bryopsis sp. KO-2023]
MAKPTWLMYSSFRFSYVRSMFILSFIFSAISKVNCSCSPNSSSSLLLIISEDARVEILFGGVTPKNFAMSKSLSSTCPPAIPPKSKAMSSALLP